METCNKTLTEFGSSNGLPNGIISGQLCAADPNAKHDTCEVIIYIVYIYVLLCIHPLSEK